jgi:hypothetical protein
VSLPQYLEWLRLSAGSGLLPSALKQNMEWVAYFSVPLVLAWWMRPIDASPAAANNGRTTLAVIVGMCGVAIAAAKPGAGAYHLMPFLPAIMWVLPRQLDTAGRSRWVTVVVPQAALVFVFAGAVIALLEQVQLAAVMQQRSSIADVEDLQGFLSTHDGVTQVGYGQRESLSFARPTAVFATGLYLIDQPAVREHQLAGLEVPEATIESLRQCRVNYWLIPKNEEPFSGVNSYDAVFLRPLYPERFRATFRAMHARVAQTRYFDVWQCRPTR